MVSITHEVTPPKVLKLSMLKLVYIRAKRTWQTNEAPSREPDIPGPTAEGATAMTARDATAIVASAPCTDGLRDLSFIDWLTLQQDRADKTGALARVMRGFWPGGRLRLAALHDAIDRVMLDYPGARLCWAHDALNLARAEWRAWRWRN
jgi:hypothetical protein